MSEPKALTNIEALEMFKEHHPDINNIEQILEFTEARFLETFTSQAPFNGDIRKARKAYRGAQRIQEQITLLWANIKDTIGSPSIKNALFNNIPDTFFQHQNLIPAYNKIFGSLDYTETDHARSILGPAAYFVDLMRFIERHINPSLQEAISKTPDEERKKQLRQHLLENRQPRLFQIPLDKESTYNLVPYIDIVNETLEDVIREKDKSPYEVLEGAKFPMDLPFHLPLEEIRLYLKQLKTSLQEIYRLFSHVGPLAFANLDGTDLTEDDSRAIFKILQDDHILDVWGRLTPKFQPEEQTFRLNLQDPNFTQYSEEIITKLQEYLALEPEIAREILALSPRERQLIEKEEISEKELQERYGMSDGALLGEGIDKLENVEVFLEQTGLEHEELIKLLNLDLSQEEINSGLARLSFINNTGDELNHIRIEPDFKKLLFRRDLDETNIVILEHLDKHFFDQSWISPAIVSPTSKVLIDEKDKQWEVTLTEQKDGGETESKTFFLVYSNGILNVSRKENNKNTHLAKIKNREFIAKLNKPKAFNTDEVKEELKNILISNQNIYPTPPNEISEVNIKILIFIESWRICDTEQDKTYVLRRVAEKRKNKDTDTFEDFDSLLVYEPSYDRLRNLSPRRLDRIYRFLKLSRKLNWSFADLDWVLRSLQGNNVGETVLRFDGVNDFINIQVNPQNISEKPNSFTSEDGSFTLEAWVNPALSGINPIFSKGFKTSEEDSTSTLQFMFWVTPSGKLAFTSEADASSLLDDKKDDIEDWKETLAQAGKRDPKIHSNNPIWDNQNPLYYDQISGELAVIDLKEIPFHDQDKIQHGITLISNQSIELGTFSHVAISVNNTAVKIEGKEYFQLKFYINGMLDSTWSLLKALPVDSVPEDAEQITINIGKNLHNECFSGDITDIRLWGGILSENSIEEYRFQRPHAKEKRPHVKDSEKKTTLVAYWPLIESPDLYIRDFAEFDAINKDRNTRFDGILGGQNHHSIPLWVKGDISLDSLPAPISKYSYQFNGINDYLGGEVQNLNSTALTLEAWIRPTEPGTHPIISYVHEGTQAYQLWLIKDMDDATNKLCRLVFWHSATGSKYISELSISAQELTHVAAVLNGNEAKLYINSSNGIDDSSDGIEDTSEIPLNASNSPSSHHLFIGRDFDVNPNYTQGNIQEVRIWSVARNKDDIESTYHHQLSGSEADLAGYWKLDETTPQKPNVRAWDQSFNQNHLLPGGLTYQYEPIPTRYDEVILPDPVEVESSVLSFDAGQYPAVIQNQKNYGLGHTEQFTVEFWFKSDKTEIQNGETENEAIAREQDRHQILLSQGDQKTGFNIYFHNGSIHAYTWLAEIDNDLVQEKELTHPIADNQWHHLTFTYDETTEKSYKTLRTIDLINTIFNQLNAGELDSILQAMLFELPDGEIEITITVNTPDRAWKIEVNLDGDDVVFILQRDENKVTILKNEEPYKILNTEDLITQIFKGFNSQELSNSIAFNIENLTPEAKDSIVIVDIPNREWRIRNYLNNEVFILRREQEDIYIFKKTPQDEITYQLYIDGILVASLSDGFRLDQVGEICLGNPKPKHYTRFMNEVPLEKAALHFKGQIADFRLWDIVSPPANISAPNSSKHPRHIPPQTEENLLCHFPMTENFGRDISNHSGPLFASDNNGLGPIIPDQSPNRNDGALSVGLDTPTWQQNITELPVFRDTVLQLNGVDQALHLPWAEDLSLLNQSFTIEIWVNISSFDKPIPLIGAGQPSLHNGIEMPRHQPLIFEVTDSGHIRAGSDHESIITSDKTIFINNWHHLCWRFNQEEEQPTQTLYIDGEPDGKPQSVNQGLFYDFPVYLGYSREEIDVNTVQHHFFDGKISELRIWNVARTNHQIQTNYNLQISSASEGLVGYWIFNQDPNSIILDQTEKSHRAELVIQPGAQSDDKWTELPAAFKRQALNINLNSDSAAPIDYIDLHTYSVLDQGTLEIWAKLNHGRSQVLFDASIPGAADYPFTIDIKRHHLRFRLLDIHGKILCAQINLHDVNADFDNQFHHIVATWDRPQQRIQLFLDDIYKDHDLHIAEETDQLLPDDVTFLTPYIGVDRNFNPLNLDLEITSTLPFRGQISQVRIWDHIRTLQEIQRYRYADLEGLLPPSQENSEPSSTVEAGLVSYLPIVQRKTDELIDLATGNSVPIRRISIPHPMPTWKVVDYYLDLDGKNDFIHLDSYTPTEKGTIELWTQFSPERNQILFDASNDDPGDTPLLQKYFILEVRDCQLRFKLEDDDDLDFKIELPSNNGSFAGFADQWHHIVVTWRYSYDYNTLEVQLGIDGQFTETSDYSIDPYSIQHSIKRLFSSSLSGGGLPEFKTLFIGNLRGDYYTDRSGFPPGWFDGKIRQVRIWKDVRTEAELRELRDVQILERKTDLIVNLLINEGAGNILRNSAQPNPQEQSGQLMVGTVSETQSTWHIYDRAVEFNGTDSFISLYGYRPQGEGCVELWVKFSRNRNQVLWDASFENHPFILEVENNCLKFKLSQHACAEYSLHNFPASFDQGWHQVAIAWNWYRESQIVTTRLFIDGQFQEVTQPAQYQNWPSYPQPYFGRSQSPTIENPPIQGQLRRMRVWKCIRSKKQLEDFRFVPFIGNEKRLAFNLPLDTGHGNQLNNLANDNPAILKQGIEPSPEWQENRPILFDFQKDYAVLPLTSTLGIINSDFTIELSVYLKNTQTEQDQAILGIRGPRDPENQHAEFAILVGTDRHVRVHYQGHQIEGTGVTLELEEWYQIICQYNQEKKRLSLLVQQTPEIEYEYDPELQSLEIIFPAPYDLAPYIYERVESYTDDRHLYLGYHRHWDSDASRWSIQKFNGYIDEVRIWKKSLTSQDLRENHDRRLKGNEPDLLAYWSLMDVQRKIFWAEGQQPPGAILNTSVDANALLRAGQPKIFLPRSAPRLDGFNDYLNFHQTFLKSDEARTLEFWFKDDKNQWRHLAAIYARENTIPRIYINGIEDAETYQDELGALVYDQVNQYTPATFFDGIVSEVRLWQGQRTAQEIRDHFDHFLTGREANLWAYWPLNEGENHHLIDHAETLNPGIYEPGLENSEEKWQRIQSAPFDPDALTSLYFDGIDDHIVLSEVSKLELDQPPYDWTFESLVFRTEFQPHTSRLFWLIVVLVRGQATHDFTIETWLQLDLTSTSSSLPVLSSIGDYSLHGQRKGLCFGFNSRRPQLTIIHEYGFHFIQVDSVELIESQLQQIDTKGILIVAQIENTGRPSQFHVYLYDWSGNRVLNQPANKSLTEDLESAIHNQQIDTPEHKNQLIQNITASLGYVLEAQTVIQSEIAITEGWHHITWQYNAFLETVSILVDGQQVVDHIHMLSALTVDSVFIGRGLHWNNESSPSNFEDCFFQGWLAELRIWHTALSIEAIQKNQLRPLLGSRNILEDLGAYWVFDSRTLTQIPNQIVKTKENAYSLILENRKERKQPTWQSIEDHPVLLFPLPQKGLSFDGQKQFLATDQWKFKTDLTEGKFTIEAWVKVASLSSDNPILWWGDRDLESSAGFELTVTTERKLAFFIEDTSPLLETNELVDENQFTHVATVIEPDPLGWRITLVLNGTALQSETVAREVVSDILAGNNILQVGRSDRGASQQYFHGLIQEIRIWNEARHEDAIQSNLYHPLSEKTLLSNVDSTHLLAYWPLTQYILIDGDRYMPNHQHENSFVAPPLRLGGLKTDRKPTSGDPVDFLDARRKVLTFPLSTESVDSIPVPNFEEPQRKNRPQRTIEIWFQCEDPFPSRKQILYEEGDSDRHLSIFIQRGQIHFEGINRPKHESGWSPASRISTYRIHPGHWHHAALILDGREEVHDNVLCALLDGRVIDTRPGSQLWGYAQAFCIGGLRKLMRVEDYKWSLPAHKFETQKGHWESIQTTVLKASERITVGSEETANPASLEFLHQGPSGTYEIWFRYPTNGDSVMSEMSDVFKFPMDIFHRGGTKRVRFDQRILGGVWHSLGRFVLEANQSRITLSNEFSVNDELLTEEINRSVVMGELKFVEVDKDSGRAISSAQPIILNANDYHQRTGVWSSEEEIVLCTKKTDIDESGVPASLAYIYRGCTGRCRVLMHYPLHQGDENTHNYASNSPIEINHRQGKTRLEINQDIFNSLITSSNGDQWQEIDLGVYELESGKSTINISNKDVDGQVIIGNFHFAFQESVDPDHQLHGQIKEVRVWETVRSLEKINETRNQLPTGERNKLLFHWESDKNADTATFSQDYLSSMKLINVIEDNLVNPNIPVMDLATVHELLEVPRLKIDSLSILWSNIKAIGNADQKTNIKAIGNADEKTEFDRVFNSSLNSNEPKWSYGLRLRWETNSQINESNTIDSRLVRSLKVQPQDLYLMLEVLSGENFDTIILNGEYLSRLYRIKQLSVLIDLNIEETIKLYKRLLLELNSVKVPVNEISNFTISDVRLIKHRSDWLKKIDVDISEYNYLVYDEVPKNDETFISNNSLIEFANNILESTQEFLLQASLIENEEFNINANAAIKIYSLLLETEVISAVKIYDSSPANRSEDEEQTSSSITSINSVVNPLKKHSEKTNAFLKDAYLQIVGQSSDWLSRYPEESLSGDILRRKAELLLSIDNSKTLLIDSLRAIRENSTTENQLSLPQQMQSEILTALNGKNMPDIANSLSALISISGSEWILPGNSLDPFYLITKKGNELHCHEIINPVLFTIVDKESSSESSQTKSLSTRRLYGNVQETIEQLDRSTIPGIIRSELDISPNSSIKISSQEWIIKDSKDKPVLVIKVGVENCLVYSLNDDYLFSINSTFKQQLENKRIQRDLRILLDRSFKELSLSERKKALPENGKLRLGNKPVVITQVWTIREKSNELFRIEISEQGLIVSQVFHLYSGKISVQQKPLFKYNPNFIEVLNSNSLPAVFHSLVKQKLEIDSGRVPTYSIRRSWILQDSDHNEKWIIILDHKQFHLCHIDAPNRYISSQDIDPEVKNQLIQGKVSKNIVKLMQDSLGIGESFNKIAISRQVWLMTLEERTDHVYVLEHLEKHHKSGHFKFDQLFPNKDQESHSLPFSINTNLAKQLDDIALQGEDSTTDDIPEVLRILFDQKKNIWEDPFRVIAAEWLLDTSDHRFTLTGRPNLLDSAKKNTIDFFMGWLDNYGRVMIPMPSKITLSQLRDAYSRVLLFSEENNTPQKLFEVRDQIQQQKQIQSNIPIYIENTLSEKRSNLEDSLYSQLSSTLNQNNTELLKTIVGSDEEGSYIYSKQEINAKVILDQIHRIQLAPDASIAKDTASILFLDLRRLSKIIFILNKFGELSELEKTTLLSNPEAYGLRRDSFASPNFSDLVRLYTFINLKDNLQEEDVLITLLSNTKPDGIEISELTNWSLLDLNSLTQKLRFKLNNTSIIEFEVLWHAFQLLEIIGADAKYLLELANIVSITHNGSSIETSRIEYKYYKYHAETLLNLVQAKYDDDTWEKVYKPIHDRISTLKRDMLTAQVMESKKDVVKGRKSPDILYEYLLLDVQTGSEVNTSFIVQAHASLQQYIQRCLMNLESKIKPGNIPQNEWLWMKNYRVWEANRKVFLYPENYIQPELRDTKTPLFIQLEEELLQGEIDEQSADKACTHYLNRFLEISNLTVVGSYYDRPKLIKEISIPIFKGEEKYNLGEVQTLLPSTAFTLAMWLNIDSQGSGSILNCLENNGDNPLGWELSYSKPSPLLGKPTTIRFKIKNNVGILTDYVDEIEGKGWYHIAICFTGSKFQFFIDARLKNIDSFDTIPSSFSYAAEQKLFFLGGQNPSSSDTFKGKIRELCFWSDSRSSSQISDIYLRGINNPQNEDNLTGYWRMNEGEGTILHDSSTSSPRNNISIDESNLKWSSTKQPSLDSIDKIPDHSSTLYLIGRNETTQEYYFRTFLNEIEWTPWRKIDISINAKFVSPVFAFNKLFIFWIELQESIQTEDRIWANKHRFFDEQGNPRQNLKLPKLDQLGNKILEGGALGGTLIPRNTQNGAKVEEVFETRNNVIEQINVPKRKPILKYSYYNFSKIWTQPQTYQEFENINAWQILQPRWQKVYAHRWRNPDLAPEVPSTELLEVNVTRLEPGFSKTKSLRPGFELNEFSTEFWLKLSNKNTTEERINREKKSSERPSNDVFTVFQYPSETPSQLKTILSSWEPIGEKAQIFNAITIARLTLLDIIRAITSINNFRSDPTQSNLSIISQIVVIFDVEGPVNNNLERMIDAIEALSVSSDKEYCQSLIDAASKTKSALDIVISIGLDTLNADQAKSLASFFNELSSVIFNSLGNIETSTTRLSEANVAKELVKSAFEAIGNDQVAANQEVDNILNDTHLPKLLNEAKDITQEHLNDKVDEDKWKRSNNSVNICIQWEQDFPIVLTTLEYESWHHIALSFSLLQGNKYKVSFNILTERERVGSREFETDVSLTSGREFKAFNESNPDSQEPTAQYEVLISDFRLWSDIRRLSDIRNDRNFRLNNIQNNNNLEFYLPLDESPSVSNSGLTLKNYSTPIKTEASQERIVLMYGDVFLTLKNTFKDISFKYKFEKTILHSGFHDLRLFNSGTTSRVDHISRGENQIEESYLPGQGYPLERYFPLDRFTVVNQKPSIVEPSVIKSALSNWQLHPLKTTLLNEKDVSTGDQLDISKSYILDVHNQPGWMILDIGDEVFLVKINFQQSLLKTSEEKLIPINPSSEGNGTPREISIYYDRDRILETDHSDSPEFEFIRLNTFAVQELSSNLFAEGIDGLLRQQTQRAQEPNFTNLVNSEPKGVTITAPKYTYMLNNDGVSSTIAKSIDNHLDFDGAYGLYYWEVFFHIPFFIANRLNSNQKFKESQKWYHYIFNPTAKTSDTSKAEYWQFEPFRKASLGTLYEIITNEQALEKYRQDPFDPHAIARLRINAYQKSVVMKYIDNLLDWGDFLFRKDTREDITEAMTLYVLAFNLLGPTPKEKPSQEAGEIGNYNDIAESLTDKNLDLGKDFPDFIVQFNKQNNSFSSSTAVPFSPNNTLINNFLIPENKELLEYWRRVEGRLYNIRHSLNIDGVFRALDLFQPPIDPSVLVKAVAGAGLAGGLSSALSSLRQPVPHYRYSVMVEKAKDILRQAIELGGALNQALEKKDAEDLTLILNTHELNILNRTTEVKKLQKEEAEASLKSLEVSLKSAQDRLQHYQSLLGAGIIKNEILNMQYLGDASDERIEASIIRSTASFLRSLPDLQIGGAGGFGSPYFTGSIGGSILSAVIELSATSREVAADIINTKSQITGILAGFERRAEDWQLQATLAGHEIKQIQHQIEANAAQVNITSREILIHEQTIKQQKELRTFYQNKFSNKALYSWMSGRLSGLYFQSYKIAFDLAKQAEKAFQFEYATNDTFINFGHWDSQKKGLLAGESLRLDLARLEKASLDRNNRHLEITKHISLAQLDPIALIQFKETGRCHFSLGELLFDRDYPGHYCRMIKTLSISIPAVVGPYQTFRATLTQTGNKTLLEPNIDGVRYLLGEEQDSPPVIRPDYRANQQIAISSGVEDSGMFELNFGDSRYLPFEGTGAVSNWHLEMPKATNPIDFNSISDVIIHLRYTCKSDGGLFKQEVMNLEAFKTYQGVRLLNLANDIASEWQTFKTDPSQLSLTFPITKNLFPPNVTVDINVDLVEIQQLFTLSTDGELSEAKSLFEIQIDPQPETPAFVLIPNKRFKREEADTLLVFITFTGQLTL